MKLPLPKTVAQLTAFLGWPKVEVSWGYYRPWISHPGKTAWVEVERFNETDLRIQYFHTMVFSPDGDSLCGETTQKPCREVPKWANVVGRIRRLG